MPADISTTHMVKLTSRESVAEGTMAFRFEKPKEFQFTPGQYVDVTLLNPPETDGEGNVRSFSIASAPFEDHIMLVTRMRDTAFKRVLKSAPLGVEAKLEGPMAHRQFVCRRSAKRSLHLRAYHLPLFLLQKTHPYEIGWIPSFLDSSFHKDL